MLTMWCRVQALTAKLDAARKHVTQLEVKMTQEQQTRAEMETALAEMADEDRRRRQRRQQKVKAMMQEKQGRGRLAETDGGWDPRAA